MSAPANFQRPRPTTHAHTQSSTTAGAPKLATAALRATDAIIQALRPQPARVAFYLPGLVSKICTLLCQSPTSLPPSSHTAACCVLRSVLSISLDPGTLPAATLRAADATAVARNYPAGHLPAVEVTPLAALHALSRASREDSSAEPRVDEASAAAATPVAAPAEPFSSARDASWLHETTATLLQRLDGALAALRSRKSAKTRAASAAMATHTLRSCAGPLGAPLTLLLLRHVLLLSTDAAQAVSAPCMALMRELAADGGGQRLALVRGAVVDVKAQSIANLRRGEGLLESELRDSCRMLAAAITSQRPRDAVQEGPGSLLGLVERLLEVDAAAAELWLQGNSGAGSPGGGALVARSAPGPSAAVQSLLAGALPGDSSAGEVAVAATAGAGGDAEAAPGLEAATAAKAAAATALASVPMGSGGGGGGGMPPGLRLVQTEEGFRAVEGVACAVGGACAVLAGPPREQGGGGGLPGDGGEAAVAAVEAVRVRVEGAVPAWRLVDGGATQGLVSACCVLCLGAAPGCGCWLAGLIKQGTRRVLWP